ncbi:hypothetical protein [Flavobacterium sp. N1994]|uniref:hypothetical protein n=1 Tax=Flavobacterium sp. N1994 TaxID=2986827 RepID=UPI0022228BE0|nr:hypothetical protein [Flavobacterium sp. N1994]
MRKFITLTVFLFCQNVFCQEYYFDIFLEYAVKNNKTDMFLLNSSYEDYLFYCYNNGGEFKGEIDDHKNNIIHHYSLKNINNSIEFKYLYSEIDTKRLEYKKAPCTIETEKYQVKQNEIDSLNQSFEIIEFTNKRKKRIYQTIYINMVKLVESKSLPSFAYGYFKDYSKCKIIDLPRGYIPSLISTETVNKDKNQIKLIQKKKINTILSIKPEDIKYN